MKKILVSMLLLAGLAAVSPVMAQRGNRVEPVERNQGRPGGDRDDHDGDGRHYKKGKHHGHHKAARAHDNRYGEKHYKGGQGKKHGKCRKEAPVRGPRRTGRG